MFWIPYASIFVFAITFVVSIILGYKRGWRAALFISLVFLALNGVVLGICAAIYKNDLWDIYKTYFMKNEMTINGIDYDVLASHYKVRVILVFAGLVSPITYGLTFVSYILLKKPLYNYLMPRVKEISSNEKELVYRKNPTPAKIVGATISGTTVLFAASYFASAVNVITTPRENENGFNKFNDALGRIYTFGLGANTEEVKAISQFLRNVDGKFVTEVQSLGDFSASQAGSALVDPAKVKASMDYLKTQIDHYSFLFNIPDATKAIFDAIVSRMNVSQLDIFCWDHATATKAQMDQNSNYVGYGLTQTEDYLKNLTAFADDKSNSLINSDLPESARQSIYDKLSGAIVEFKQSQFYKDWERYNIELNGDGKGQKSLSSMITERIENANDLNGDIHKLLSTQATLKNRIVELTGWNAVQHFATATSTDSDYSKRNELWFQSNGNDVTESTGDFGGDIFLNVPSISLEPNLNASAESAPSTFNFVSKDSSRVSTDSLLGHAIAKYNASATETTQAFNNWVSSYATFIGFRDGEYKTSIKHKNDLKTAQDNAYQAWQSKENDLRNAIQRRDEAQRGYENDQRDIDAQQVIINKQTTLIGDNSNGLTKQVNDAKDAYDTSYRASQSLLTARSVAQTKRDNADEEKRLAADAYSTAKVDYSTAAAAKVVANKALKDVSDEIKTLEAIDATKITDAQKARLAELNTKLPALKLASDDADQKEIAAKDIQTRAEARDTKAKADATLAYNEWKTANDNYNAKQADTDSKETTWRNLSNNLSNARTTKTTAESAKLSAERSHADHLSTYNSKVTEIGDQNRGLIKEVADNHNTYNAATDELNKFESGKLAQDKNQNQSNFNAQQSLLNNFRNKEQISKADFGRLDSLQQELKNKLVNASNGGSNDSLEQANNNLDNNQSRLDTLTLNVSQVNNDSLVSSLLDNDSRTKYDQNNKATNLIAAKVGQDASTWVNPSNGQSYQDDGSIYYYVMRMRFVTSKESQTRTIRDDKSQDYSTIYKEVTSDFKKYCGLE